DILAGAFGFFGFRSGSEESGAGFLVLQVHTIKCIDRRAVDGNGNLNVVSLLILDLGEHAMFIRTPVGEAAQVLEDTLGVGVEDMRSVGVDENAVFVVLIVRISPNMGALIDNQNRFI